MNLNILVNNSLKRIQEEGYVEAVVEEQIKKSIKSIVDDLFRDWGPFGKNLKEEIEKKLKVNLDKLDIASYNYILNNTIQQQLDEVIHVHGVEKMKKSVEDFLVSAKDEYRLSELIEIMKAEEARKNECFLDQISLHIEHCDCTSLIFINFDPDNKVKDFRCKYRMVVNGENNSVSAIEINGEKFDNKVIMGGLRGFNKMLFQIYANGSKVIVDEDEINIYYED